MLKEFREFAIKGNVIDLAVGVIIGAAFGKIVTSLVEDILMPPVGKFIGKVDFASLFVNLSDTPVASIADAKAKGVPVIAYGNFLNILINFIILAFIVFLMVRAINKLKKTEAAAAASAPPTKSEELLTEIRDSLRAR